MEYNVNIALSFEIIVNSGKVIIFDVIAGVHNNNNNNNNNNNKKVVDRS